MGQAVIFDIDGTIIDSVGLHIESWKRAVQQFGKEVPHEPIRRQIGKGADEFLAVFFSKEELDRFRSELEVLIFAVDFYLRLGNQHVAFFLWFCRLLAFFSSRSRAG